MVVYAASPSTVNWQQQQQLQRIGLSPGARIGMWVLFSIIILFIVHWLVAYVVLLQQDLWSWTADQRRGY